MQGTCQRRDKYNCVAGQYHSGLCCGYKERACCLKYGNHSENVDIKFSVGVVVVVIVRQLDLQLHVQSVSIISKVVSSNLAHGEVSSI